MSSSRLETFSDSVFCHCGNAIGVTSSSVHGLGLTAMIAEDALPS
jgi:hypothetical protein